MNSIIQTEKECFMCGCMTGLESHHIFGASNRKWSEKYGLKVWLCHNCHNEPPNGVHHNRENADKLYKLGQKAFINQYPELNFMDIFKRNFL